MELQSKHILVSGEFKDALKAALDAKPDGSGREAYQIRRAGEILQEERVPLPGYSFTFGQLYKMRSGVSVSVE